MEWFLINQNEHLGPFSESDLHELFNAGDVSKDSLVWREGWNDAQSYEDVFLLNEEQKTFSPIGENLEVVYDNTSDGGVIKDEELPPDLPPEVLSFKEKVQDIKNVVQESKDEVPPMPNDSHLDGQNNLNTPRPTHKMEEFEEEINVEDAFESDFDVASEEKKLHKIVRQVIIGVITLAIMLPAFLYISKNEEIFSRPRTMSLEDYEKLSAVAKDQSKDLKFSFSLATDKRTLWLSTNIALEGEVFVNLKSKNNRTLGGMVEVKAKGILEKHLIVLTEFQFIQGTKFVDGYYDAELYTVDDLSEPFYNRFFEPREKQFRYFNDVLITSLHPVEFEKLLEKKNQKRANNQSRFWEELKEQYRTVRFMTKNIKMSLEELFKKSPEKWQDNVAEFEKTYSSRYGVPFTQFILNVDNKYKTLMKKDFPNKTKIVSHYTKLKNLAKEIGEETISVMENLKSTNVLSLNREQLQDLKFNSMLKFKLIIKECDEMVEKL